MGSIVRAENQRDVDETIFFKLSAEKPRISDENESCY